MGTSYSSSSATRTATTWIFLGSTAGSSFAGAETNSITAKTADTMEPNAYNPFLTIYE